MQNALVIVDLQHHAKGGHFATWLRYAVAEARKHWQALIIYTADSVQKVDLSTHSTSAVSIQQFSVADVHKFTPYKGDILGVLARHQEEILPHCGTPPFFVLWAQQYAERTKLHRQRWFHRLSKRKTTFNRPWGSLFSLSSLVYDDTCARPHPMESKVGQILNADSSCVGMLVWDENVARHYAQRCIYVPDVEELYDDETWALSVERPIVLGSVGQLWGYRSMNLLAELLEHEPEVHGYAAGAPFPESYSRAAWSMATEKSPRFCFQPGFLPGDEGLRHALARLDGFVIDSRTYKVPSGLAIRAMSMGRPIVTIDRDSWIARHIKSNGVGVFWQKGRGSLEADLREWFESGGPARSKALAAKLSDQAGMEAAFAEMFRRLKAASGQN